MDAQTLMSEGAADSYTAGKPIRRPACKDTVLGQEALISGPMCSYSWTSSNGIVRRCAQPMDCRRCRSCYTHCGCERERGCGVKAGGGCDGGKDAHGRRGETAVLMPGHMNAEQMGQYCRTVGSGFPEGTNGEVEEEDPFAVSFMEPVPRLGRGMPEPPRGNEPVSSEHFDAEVASGRDEALHRAELELGLQSHAEDSVKEMGDEEDDIVEIVRFTPRGAGCLSCGLIVCDTLYGKDMHTPDQESGISQKRMHKPEESGPDASQAALARRVQRVPSWWRSGDLAYTEPVTRPDVIQDPWLLEIDSGSIHLKMGGGRKKVVNTTSDLFFNEWYSTPRRLWLSRGARALEVIHQLYEYVNSGEIKLVTKPTMEPGTVWFDCPMPPYLGREVKGTDKTYVDSSMWWTGAVKTKSVYTGPALVVTELLVPVGVQWCGGATPRLEPSARTTGTYWDRKRAGVDSWLLVKLLYEDPRVEKPIYVNLCDLALEHEPVIVLDTTVLAYRESVGEECHIIGRHSGAWLGNWKDSEGSMTVESPHKGDALFDVRQQKLCPTVDLLEEVTALLSSGKLGDDGPIEVHRISRELDTGVTEISHSLSDPEYSPVEGRTFTGMTRDYYNEGSRYYAQAEAAVADSKPEDEVNVAVTSTESDVRIMKVEVAGDGFLQTAEPA